MTEKKETARGGLATSSHICCAATYFFAVDFS